MAKNAHDDAEQDDLKALIYDFARVLGCKVSFCQRLIIIDGENDTNGSSKDAVAEC